MIFGLKQYQDMRPKETVLPIKKNKNKSLNLKILGRLKKKSKRLKVIFILFIIFSGGKIPNIAEAIMAGR